MKEIIMIIRPEKLEDVKNIADELGCSGMTISSVMGCGVQKGSTSDVVNQIKGFKTTINLLPKIRVEIVVNDELVESLISKVCETVRTDNYGDGRIFIRNIEESIRIRTGERGKKTL